MLSDEVSALFCFTLHSHYKTAEQKSKALPLSKQVLASQLMVPCIIVYLRPIYLPSLILCLLLCHGGIKHPRYPDYLG